MKYLLINSQAGLGSTGRLAAEASRRLMGEGHSCVLAYGWEKGNCEDIPCVKIGTKMDLYTHALKTRLLDGHGFGSYGATRKFLRWVREYDPDVVWLHNIHGYYLHMELLFAYLKETRKQVIWTLHDCWSFTGHCPHFEAVGCERWKTGCGHCPQSRAYPVSWFWDGSRQNYQRKRRAFTGVPELTIITPSQWLAELVGESFLKDYPVQVVPNEIDTALFRPTPGDFRRRYGLENRKILLAVASAWTERKGLQDLLFLSRNLDAAVVLVGHSENLPDTVLALPKIHDRRQLAEIYSAADLFVNPTYEDTYPTVNLEARACGCRVVSYDTGGCRETLGPGDVLVPRGDRMALLDALREALERGETE